MADRSVATTDTFEVFRTTYNSTGADVGDIGTLSSTIAATDLVDAVNENETAIIANAATAATNATNIATNVTSIATNATNIATNTTAIAALPTAGFSIAMAVALG